MSKKTSEVPNEHALNLADDKKDGPTVKPDEDAGTGIRTTLREDTETRETLSHDLCQRKLESVRNYLVGIPNRTLDEDEIANKMIKIHQLAMERTRNRCNLIDTSSDEEQIQGYEMEKKLVLQHDFIKGIAAGVKAVDKRQLDKKTLNWLRRGLGMKKKNYERDLSDRPQETREQTDDSDENSEIGGHSRRLTRGMARSTRIRRREERVTRENQGIEALKSAIEQLEVEFGAFVIPSKPSTPVESPQKRRLTNSSTKRKATGIQPLISSRSTPRAKRKAPEKPTTSSDDFSVSESEDGALVAMAPNLMKITKVVVGGESFRDKDSSLSEGPRAKRSSTQKRTPSKGCSPSMSSFPALSPSKNGLFSGDTPMSLSLLEWRRRQQWMPSKEKVIADEDDCDEDDENHIFTVPSKLACASGLDTKLPSWDIINPVAHLSMGHLPLNDPPRSRHDNTTYARWCCSLINALNGSARSWARFEFFYSDIDRPWFNKNDFNDQLAKNGISPHSKLTMSEWSAIRRAIRGRPRRFSKRFVAEQLGQLVEYRKKVRRLQHVRLFPPRRCTHGIPPAIKVGATVTAYSRRFQILHRGSVLAHDHIRNFYLVQFERKELGFEFCPDIEVATHGIPESLMRTTELMFDGTNVGSVEDDNSAVGSSVYGTGYGPSPVSPEENSNQVNRHPLHLRVHPSKLNDQSGPQRDPLSAESCLSRSVQLVEKVAEREVITKLVDIIGSAIRRKQMILECMEKCHRVLEMSGAASASKSDEFSEHYAWLRVNLEATSRCLESALLHMQVMYSDAYAGCSVPKSQETPSRNWARAVAMLSSGGHVVDLANGHPFVSWKNCLLNSADAVTSGMFSSQGAEGSSSARLEFLSRALAAATSMILSSAYIKHAPTSMGQPSWPLGAVVSALSDQKLMLKSPSLTTQVCEEDPLLANCLNRRQDALDKLQMAIHGFGAEIAVADPDRGIGS